jgi:hypothetical protein
MHVDQSSVGWLSSNVPPSATGSAAVGIMGVGRWSLIRDLRAWRPQRILDHCIPALD